MSMDERSLRFENALATLSELAAKSEERLDLAHQRLDELTQLVAQSEQRQNTADQRLDVLTELASNFDAVWTESMGA